MISPPIDQIYRSSIISKGTPPSTNTIGSKFNYSTVDNLYGQGVLLYTGLIPGTNPLANSEDGAKYSVNGIDIVEKVEKLILSSVEESFFAFSDERLTHIIPNPAFRITLWSKDQSGNYTVQIPTNLYDIFFYDKIQSYVIYFKEKYPPIYNNGNLDNPSYNPAITCYRYCGPKGTENIPSADERTKVSSNDTTPGFLNGKLVAGTGILLTENNNGANETLTISTNVVDMDVKVAVSANDTTAGFLNGKLVAGTGILLTENNNGANETLTVATTSLNEFFLMGG